MYVINDLLNEAVKSGASDVHLTVGTPPIFRLNGTLTRMGHYALTAADTETMARAILRAEDWQQVMNLGEADSAYRLTSGTRFRVNAYRQREAVSIALRTIPARIPSIEGLGLPEAVHRFVERPYGLVLVTGPTGSGKSTSLAAMIDAINEKQTKHVVTLEDPIEYVHTNKRSLIQQREIGSDTSTFASGLRASLRQDPDVILVGEMRDLETISIALTAAETGHLVFGTLHTSTAPSTIERMIDVFHATQQQQIRVQIANSLVGVMSQRLLPRADGRGRIAATEVLVNTPAVANLIRGEKTHQIANVLQTGKQFGMHTMRSSVSHLLAQGVVTRDVAEPFLAELV
ncbi:MAG: type IV pilus twitching motility protein PilT [Bacilli bacterium]